MPQTIDEAKMLDKGKGNQSFDINQPPMKNIPHMEFPKVMYLWPKDKKLSPTSRTLVVQDAKEEKAMLAKGWRNAPHVQEFEEEVPEGFEADLGAKAN